MVHGGQWVASITVQQLWNRDANPECVLLPTMGADAQTGVDGEDGVGMSGYYALAGGQVHLRKAGSKGGNQDSVPHLRSPD